MNGVRTQIVALVVIGLALLPTAVNALDVRAAEQAGAAATESFTGDVYLAGGTVTSAADVPGDLSVAGGTVIISGPVGSDLLAAGGSITVVGNVGDDIRALGGTVVVQGAVSGDAIIAAGQVELQGNGISGDVAIAGGSVDIETPVMGQLKVVGGEVKINGIVAGDVDVRCDTLVLGPKADIQGALRYSAREQAQIDPQASLVSDPVFTPQTRSDIPSGATKAIISLALITKLLMCLVAAFAVYFFFPNFAKELVREGAEGSVSSLGIGFVFLVVTPVTAIILLATVIGMPIGILTILGYILAILFSVLVAPILVGGILQNWISKKGLVVNWQTILIGVAVYSLIGLVPVLGGVIKFVAFLVSMGAVLRIKWTAAKHWR